MKREEFISELRLRLGRLPKEDLEDVLDYYNELFLDGGEENEEKTAASFGSIDQVARQIYVDNGIDPDGKPEFMMEEYVEPKKNDIPPQNAGPLPINQPMRSQVPQVGVNWTKVLLAILLFPFWFPIFVVCLVLTCVGFFLGLLFLFILVVVGGTAVISGLLCIAEIPPLGLIQIGGGLMALGVFGLLLPKLGRGIIRGIVNGTNKIVNRAHSIFFGGVQYENR